MPHAEKFKTRLLEERDRLARLIGRARTNVAEHEPMGVSEAWKTTPRPRATGFVENSGDDGVGDAAADMFAMELDLAMLGKHRHQCEAVEAALGRLEDGTYGTCIRCQAKITVGRLEAIPETAYCVGCESDVEVMG